MERWMLPEISSLNSIFYINSKLFINSMESVTQELFLKRPDSNINNIAFIAAHLLDARFFMSTIAGIKIENPYQEVFDKIKSPNQLDEFPQVENIISLWKEISVPLESRFKLLTPEDLAKECTIQLPLTEKTVLGGLTFLLQHESFHIGQIALLRKHLGLMPMRYV
jgi:uncharacterized damage-inducible protein DinB